MQEPPPSRGFSGTLTVVALVTVGVTAGYLHFAVPGSPTSLFIALPIVILATVAAAAAALRERDWFMAAIDFAIATPAAIELIGLLTFEGD